jgi:hypothetical protein
MSVGDSFTGINLYQVVGYLQIEYFLFRRKFAFTRLDCQQPVLVALFLRGEIQQDFFHAGLLGAIGQFRVEIGGLLFLVDGVVQYFINGIHVSSPCQPELL